MIKNVIPLLMLAGTLASFTNPPNYTYSPWIPDTLVMQPSVTGTYQSSELAVVQASFGTAYDIYALEVGAEAFHSKETSFSFDDVYLTGRYLLLNQNIGDPLFVAVGAKFGFVSSIAIKEKDLFHFGNFEALLFGSVGSEQFCSEFATDWTSRWWLTAGAGIANRRSPWFVGNGAYEYAFCPNKRVRLFADATIGIGHLQKALDLGVAGTYESFDYGGLDASYAYRVYGQHVSRRVSTFTLSYYYPFGI